MMGTSNDDGIYEGLLKTYGPPDSRGNIDSNGTEKIWYQLQSNKTRYFIFDIKDEKIINHEWKLNTNINQFVLMTQLTNSIKL